MSFLSAIDFNWYGFLIGAGMAICIVGAYFVSRKRGITGDLILDIALICIPLALVGARIYYVIFDAIAGGHWDFARFFGFYNGKFEGFAGLAIYGGLIGAVLGGVIIVMVRRNKPDELKITFMQLLDLGFAFIILGQAIGRWGNFANGEAYGYEITDPALQWFPFGVNINGTWHLATFFYESSWNIIGFAMLLYLYIGKRKSFDGFIFSCYCIWYGIGRAWIEGLRTDSLWLVPNVIRVSQLLSIILIFLGAGIIIYHIVMARRAGKKLFLFVPDDQLSCDYYGYETSKLNKPMKGSLLYKEPLLAAVNLVSDKSVASNAEHNGGIEAESGEAKVNAEVNSLEDAVTTVEPLQGVIAATASEISDEIPTNLSAPPEESVATVNEPLQSESAATPETTTTPEITTTPETTTTAETTETPDTTVKPKTAATPKTAASKSKTTSTKPKTTSAKPKTSTAAKKTGGGSNKTASSKAKTTSTKTKKSE